MFFHPHVSAEPVVANRKLFTNDIPHAANARRYPLDALNLIWQVAVVPLDD
jgi:hypothetical protein